MTSETCGGPARRSPMQSWNRWKAAESDSAVSFPCQSRLPYRRRSSGDRFLVPGIAAPPPGSGGPARAGAEPGADLLT